MSSKEIGLELNLGHFLWRRLFISRSSGKYVRKRFLGLEILVSVVLISFLILSSCLAYQSDFLTPQKRHGRCKNCYCWNDTNERDLQTSDAGNL